MKILFLGDCHGNWATLFMSINEAVKRKIEFDCIFQVGDFGFYPGAIKRLILLRKQLGFDKIPIHFIEGNHENHKYLFESNKKKLKAEGLIYHPRGSVWEVDGKKIGCMGGAFNVDRPQEVFLVEKDDGFVQRVISNYPQEWEIDSFADRLNEKEGQLDLMVTHSCPGGVGFNVPGSIHFEGLSKMFTVDANHASQTYPINDCGDEPLTKLWNKLEEKPKKWVFGHFHKHTYSLVGDCRTWCIGCCDSAFDDIHHYVYDTESDWFSKV